MKILLTESCIFMRTGIEKILSDEGYIVVAAESRKQFCLFSKKRFDVIILDTHMLGTLSFEFAHKLMQVKNKPILIATYETANYSTISYPYDKMLRKPFDKDKLLDAIEKGIKINDKEIHASTSSKIIISKYANHMVENGARSFS